MKKRYNRNRGFVLIMVISLIAIIAFAMAYMSSISNNLAFQTDGAYLDAYRSNIIASGLVWAKHNSKQLSQSETIELDTSSLASRSELKVTRTGRNKVWVSILCRSGRQKNRSNEVYLLDKQ